MISQEDRTNWLLIASGTAFCLLSFLALLLGKHHVDEGYYHLIAHLTARGDLPYRDYLYVQTPLFPIVYGSIFKLFGASFLLARGVSVLFSLINFILAIRLAGKKQGPVAAGVAALFILCQPFTVYYLTIVKLYALTGLLLTILVTVLTLRLNAVTKYSLAAALASLCIAVRLTMMPALPIVIALALLRTRGKERLVTVSVALLSGVLILVATLLPFYLISPDTFGYSVVGYHLDKEGFSLQRQILHKFDVSCRLSRLYFPLLLSLAVLLIVKLSKWRNLMGSLTHTDSDGYTDGLIVTAGVVLFHFTSQAPYVHRYLAMLIPTVAALLAPEIVKFLSKYWSVNTAGSGVSCCLIGVLTLIAMGQWEIEWGRPNPNAQLKSIASQINFLTGEGDPILTFNNSVAVESDRPVLDGDEMNVLTYHPEWDRNRCETFHVLNVDMLEEALIENRLRAVLITQYSFLGNFPTFYNPGEEGARPRIMAALEKHYHRTNVFNGFGYLGEPAELYLPLNQKRQTNGAESQAPIQIFRNDRDNY